MLTIAADEYEAAIAGGKFVELVEYQDSRGFVLYSERLYQSIAKQMLKQHPKKHKVISNNLQNLKKVWPSVIPPERPIKTPLEVLKLVDNIRQEIASR